MESTRPVVRSICVLLAAGFLFIATESPGLTPACPVNLQAARNYPITGPAGEERADAALDWIARRRGFRYLGAGTESSVYLDPAASTVRKINRASANVGPDGRTALVDTKVAGHQTLRSHLGGVVIDQEVGVRKHVLGKHPTVQVEQRYVDFGPQDSPFVPARVFVDVNRLDRITQAIPGIDDELHDFVINSRRMFEEDRVLPDTYGGDNVVVEEDHSALTLLDTTPIGAEHPAVQRFILMQLDALEEGLRAVA